MSIENITFHRCPHDADHPYLMISRSLIRDQSISPECRWLIIYLLANTEGFTINIKQVMSHLSPKEDSKKKFWGRDVIYKLVNEAIEAGYIKRTEKIVKQPKGFLQRTEYLVSESPKFK